jgi:DNA-binding transcriptional ArsR family regulator
MTQSPLSELVQWLRASGEPSRMRLLALCADAALSVSDLAHALRQSEPRVSRHLKILCESGLLERLRQGQWVLYRLSPAPEASSFVRGLLAQLDRRDPLLLRDAASARAASATDERSPGAGSESRLGRALAEFVAALTPAQRFDSLLVVGVTHPELLLWAAGAARHCTALAPSRRAAQSARALAEQRALSCRVLQVRPDAAGFDAGLATAGPHFDALLLDHPITSGDTLVGLLESARALIEPAGRLWLFEPYDALEGSRDRVVEHPLARLRRLLGAAGLHCEKLSPIEADGAHVLAALARPVAAGPALSAGAHGAAS